MALDLLRQTKGMECLVKQGMADGASCQLFQATSGSCGCEPPLSRPLIVRIGLNPQPKADVPRHLRSYGDLVLVRGKSVLAINLS